uniref:Fibrinogen C-terminal domain-containing protein n=1 Tax=Macrostomum lignano TaxID=282301 RepID=A0A1I8FRR0_9PLAT
LRDCLRRILGCVRGSSGGCCVTLIGSGSCYSFIWFLNYYCFWRLRDLVTSGCGHCGCGGGNCWGVSGRGCGGRRDGTKAAGGVQQSGSLQARSETWPSLDSSVQRRLEMFGKLLMMATALSVTFTAAQAAEFSIQPVSDPIAISDQKTLPGRNERDCAMRCELLGSLVCSAVSFVRESGLCLLSAVRNASFGAAGAAARCFGALPAGWSRRQPKLCSNWTEYENGFGDGYDFWIGLRIINELTENSPRLLRVEAVTWSNVLYVCEYSNFTVGNSTTNYTMNYGSYLTASSNTSMDSLNYHRGRPFTTIDRDNDQNPSGACTDTRGFAGWWYANCCNANPNGMYFHSAVTDMSAMVWFGATSSSYIALKSIRLMLYLA